MEAEAGIWRCAACGDVIGVYEPVVVIVNGQAAGTTSLAALGDIVDEGVVLEHGECAKRTDDE